jgi:hypothetical protein
LLSEEHGLHLLQGETRIPEILFVFSGGSINVPFLARPGMPEENSIRTILSG